MKIKYIFPLLLVLFTFSCHNELTIFEQIDTETKLEEAVIKGIVTSLTQFKGKLYACDGNIYSKDPNVVRSWASSSKPSGNIIKLAADANNLYALNKSRELYTTTDGTNWTKVDTTSTGSISTIFDNGSTTESKAYLKGTNNKFYALPGLTDANEVTSIVVLKTDNGTYTASKDGADGIVEGKGTDGSTDLSSIRDLGTVYSLTYSVQDSSIYAGTSKGLRRLSIDSTGKLTGNHNPPSNYDATIKSYESFAVMATGTDANNSALYTGTIATKSVNSKINGLWGYYYNRRDKWNRE